MDQLLRRIPVDHSRDPQEHNEGWVPCCIENVTCDEQVDLLRRPVEWHRVQHEHTREEDQECERIKNHVRILRSLANENPLGTQTNREHGAKLLSPFLKNQMQSRQIQLECIAKH